LSIVTRDLGPESPREDAEPWIVPIRHVLVCLDRSPLAEGCLPLGRSVAEAYDANITLLHVLASPDLDDPNRLDALEWEVSRREAERYLTSTESRLIDEGLLPDRVATEVAQGRPAERIVSVAWDIEADLTVLSRHGERGSGPRRLGSTAQQVLAVAPGSVLLAPADRGLVASVPAKRIALAVDGSLRAQSTLPAAAHLARFYGADVLLMHVVAEPKATAVFSSESDIRLAQSLASRRELGAREYLATLRERIFSDVANVETLVLRAVNVRRALLESATRWGADLLILAAHGTTCDDERPFGSVAIQVLEHSQIPVLVLQDLTSRERDSFRPHAATSDAPNSARASLDSRSLEGN